MRYPAGWNTIMSTSNRLVWAFFPRDTDNQYHYILRINEDAGLVYVYASPDDQSSLESIKIPNTPMDIEEKKAWAIATYRMTH